MARAPLLQALLDRIDRELVSPDWAREIAAWEHALPPPAGRPDDRAARRRGARPASTSGSIASGFLRLEDGRRGGRARGGRGGRVVTRAPRRLLAVDVGNTNTVLGLYEGGGARALTGASRRAGTRRPTRSRSPFAGCSPRPGAWPSPAGGHRRDRRPVAALSAAAGVSPALRRRASVRRARREDRDADPLRRAAGSRRRPHRQRRGGARAVRRSVHRRGLRNRDDVRRRHREGASTSAA